MTPEEEAEALEFLVARAARLKARQIRVKPYGRGMGYDYKEVKHILAIGRKICTKCRLEKSLGEFDERVEHPTGRRSSCKACGAKAFANYRRDNVEEKRRRERARRYRNIYGMSEAEANTLSFDRTGLCEICRKIKKLVVDHCHTSGKVRGRVCPQCNTLLGCAGDSSEILFSAAEYLSRAEELQSG